MTMRRRRRPRLFNDIKTADWCAVGINNIQE